MEPHATIAVWDGDERLTLYDATQGVFGRAPARSRDAFGLAAGERARDLPVRRRRLRLQGLGRGRTSSLAALAARELSSGR